MLPRLLALEVAHQRSLPGVPFLGYGSYFLISHQLLTTTKTSGHAHMNPVLMQILKVNS